MITRNMMNLMAIMPQSSGTNAAMLSILDVYGMQRYLTPNMTSFPSSRTETFSNSATTAGISIGTGSTAAKATDFNLENTITSGVNVSITSNTIGMDGDSPYHEYKLTITNNSGAALTITEVGYKQNVKALLYPGQSSPSDYVALLDRTVLATPLTIQAGDAGVLVYTLKTIPPQKTVSGVKIVSFTYGTDEEVVAMIDAARLGTIDLQADGGWQVGDTRAIDISAWTGGGSVSHAAQTLGIAITQFGDYMNCGCLFQFDFVESFATGQRMNSSATNVGGYGTTEMYNTTLPALVNALPEWLRTRLKTFSVLASAGNQSTTINTVTGNQLALRSEIEIFGTRTYSAEGEGTQVEWYKGSTQQRTKRQGRTGSAYAWWERSPYASNAYGFCAVSSSGSAGSGNAINANGLSPFGCI